MLEPDFFQTFYFFDFQNEFKLDSNGDISVVARGSKEWIGKYEITQIFGELFTPQLYQINMTFIFDYLPDTSEDAEIREEAAAIIAEYESKI